MLLCFLLDLIMNLACLADLCGPFTSGVARGEEAWQVAQYAIRF